MKKFFFFDYDRFSYLIPEFAKMEKTILSRTIDDDNYTAVSQLFYEKTLAGSIWEIYNLPNLLKVYQTRKKLTYK